MDIYELFYVFALGLPAGFLPAFFWVRLERKYHLKKASIEGEHIFQEALEKEESFQERRKREFYTNRKSKFKLFEREKEEKATFLQELKAENENKSYQYHLKGREIKSALKAVKFEAFQIQKSKTEGGRQKKLLLKQLEQQRSDHLLALQKRFPYEITQMRDLMKKDIEERFLKNSQKTQKSKRLGILKIFKKTPAFC